MGPLFRYYLCTDILSICSAKSPLIKRSLQITGRLEEIDGNAEGLVHPHILSEKFAGALFQFSRASFKPSEVFLMYSELCLHCSCDTVAEMVSETYVASI